MGNGQRIEIALRVEEVFSDKLTMSDEDIYNWQMDIRANYLIIKDSKHNIPVMHTSNYLPFIKTDIKWINSGELIAGSFLCNIAAGGLSVDFGDIDIYFKCKTDIYRFCSLNDLYISNEQKADLDLNASRISVRCSTGYQTLNLIFGVNYQDAADLITHFDIRACSIAYDPNNNTVHYVAGALNDVIRRRIVFNPIPHNTTISRLVKYVKKSFEIDAYQRLFFAELIKSDMYNPSLEMSTGYRAIVYGKI